MLNVTEVKFSVLRRSMITCSGAHILRIGVMIGKYERDEASPSIDAAKKIADALGVSLDALVGQDKFSGLNRATIKRIEEMEQLDTDTKHHLFFLIDNVIQNYKTKKAFG